MDPQRKMLKALNKLTKWRSVFAGWQLGTRSDTDVEAKALKDHREQSMVLRVEVTALVGLMLEKGVFTLEEFQNAVALEAGELEKMLERKFPGFRATDDGMSMDLITIQKHGTTDGWRP